MSDYQNTLALYRKAVIDYYGQVMIDTIFKRCLLNDATVNILKYVEMLRPTPPLPTIPIHQVQAFYAYLLSDERGICTDKLLVQDCLEIYLSQKKKH